MRTTADAMMNDADQSLTEVGPSAGSSQGKIQSVDRALSMLELLAESKGKLRLNDISKHLGLNVSTCHHLLGTLVARGYVSQSPVDRRYFLGNKILELGRSRMGQFDLIELAMGGLTTLNEVTGETVHLAAMQGGDVVTLAVLDSRHAIRVVSDAGDKSGALHATATGKAMLAWLPEPEIDRIITRKGLTKFTDKTISNRAALMAELRHVRRNGFAIDREEYEPGVICLGAAIRDHAGAVMGSFSCSTPSMRATEEHIQLVEQAIKEMAATLSKTIGGGSGADISAND